ncbi:MAG: polysaccharide biosynthesis C-terminal domain-containing protein [Bacteroidetes bacterium]|nr:polysaccharide biosynthesis C-terminal domain-containing protein [Bacteroidota bacterium]
MLKKIISTLFTKSSAAIISFAILLVSSKLLGGEVRGQISLLILNIAIIQTVNEIYTGYALVHFIPKFSFSKVYTSGLLWSVFCTTLLSLFFYFFHIGLTAYWIHLFILSFIIIVHSFHLVLILGKNSIRLYNILSFSQPALLLLSLLVCIYVYNIRTIDAYVIALYVSFVPPAIFSFLGVLAIARHSHDAKPYHAREIYTNGFYNQMANLSHMLSNRYNFYLLGNNMLVGVYAGATSLIESVWIISNSVAPIILTHIANAQKNEENSKVTFVLAKVCFLLSCTCVLVLVFIPAEFFVFLLGKDFENTKSVMLHLSPGILFISFSTIISHYFSGMGRQRLIAIANFSGLLTTVSTAYVLVHNFQLIGACYATSLSYLVASLVLVISFMREHKFGLTDLFSLRKSIRLIKETR